MGKQKCVECGEAVGHLLRCRAGRGEAVAALERRHLAREAVEAAAMARLLRGRVAELEQLVVDQRDVLLTMKAARDAALARVAELEAELLDYKRYLSTERGTLDGVLDERDAALAVIERVRELARGTTQRAVELRRNANQHDNGRATAYEDVAAELETVLPKEPLP